MKWLLKKRDISAPQNHLLSLAKAVIKNPEDEASLEAFSAALRKEQALPKWHPSLEIALIITLESRLDTKTQLTDAWYRILSANPAFSGVFSLASYERYEDFKNRVSRTNAETLLQNPLFCTGLKIFLLTNLGLERLLTHIRRFLLDCRTEREKAAKNLLPLTSALALYCFNAGYILGITDQEKRQVADLRERLMESDDAETPFNLALLGCYEALCAHPKAAAFESLYSKHPHLSPVIRETVTEPLREKEIASGIPCLTPIEGEISVAVCEQYKEFPYPRWRVVDRTSPYPPALESIRDRALNILVAGCGTGYEPLRLAHYFQKSKILAVDLSPASLAYAIRKAQEANFKNIEYAQADILRLPQAIGQQFDFISSGGVLHHMEIPEKGFAALDRLLKPDGIMYIGLYSRIARKHITNIQRIIAENGYGNTAEEIRRFRKDCPGLVPLDDMASLLKVRDFFIMSQCRDLLFHVMEHQFDIPRIAAMLEKNGYEIAEFIVGRKIREQFVSRFPDDPQALSLENWAAFEESNPDTFLTMYNFICRKSAGSPPG